MHQGSFIVEVDGNKSLVVTLSAKVIIHKSRGEVSPVDQDTIECVSTAYFLKELPKKTAFKSS